MEDGGGSGKSNNGGKSRGLVQRTVSYQSTILPQTRQQYSLVICTVFSRRRQSRGLLYKHSTNLEIHLAADGHPKCHLTAYTDKAKPKFKKRNYIVTCTGHS